ncbi:4455_t:CDS:1, partial [Funneliformis caledonium]
LENETDSQESNIDKVVFTDDINSKLEKALESFRIKFGVS